MLRLKSIICCIVLLSLAFPLGNALAKRAKFDESSVSAINLDVVRVEACARGKGCVVAGGPMQVDLLDMAKDNIDYVNQVLLPEKTKRLRLILGDNSTITVDGESFPLTVPSGKTTGLKLWGWRAFPEEGGFLSNLELKLNLKRQIVVKRERDRSAWISWKDWRAQYTGDNWRKDWRDELKKRRNSYVYSYKLKPVIRVLSAGVEQLTEDVAAVVAMPDKESEIKIGDKFSLFIPAGAVSAPMVISVEETKFTVEIWDEEAGEVVEKPALSSNYELSPDGAEFAEPLVITIPYYPDTLSPDVSEYDLAVYLDAEKIPTDINTISKTATADVWHFTDACVNDEEEQTFQTQMPVTFQDWNFGWRFMSDERPSYTAYHPGTDLNALNDSNGNVTVRAIADGKVVANSSGWGGIVIEHTIGDKRYYSQYGHINHLDDETELAVEKTVTRNQAIGYIGNTGPRGTPFHLHFEIRSALHSDPDNADYWKDNATNRKCNDSDICLDTRKDVFKGYESPLAFVRSYLNPHQTVIIVEDSVTYPNISDDITDNKVVVDGDVIKERFFEPDNLSEWNNGEEYCGENIHSSRKDPKYKKKLGFGGNYHYASTVFGDETSAGKWHFDIPESGTYTIYVFIPHWYATTIQANYEIFHNSKIDHVLINQNDVNGSFEERWKSLGVFDFKSGNNHYVRLGNNTGETGRHVAFDAIKLVQISSEPDPEPVINSISPLTATLDELTTFTVTGEDLPSTLALWIKDCENVTSLGGTSTSMQFSCTPSWTTGKKAGEVKDAEGGEILHNFTIDVEETEIPEVTSVSPNKATLDELTTFTVTGEALPSTLALWIKDCENVTSLGGTSTSMQFSCTPSWTTGEKDGKVKDEPGGTVLKKFTVNVSESGGSDPEESFTCTSGDQTAMWNGREWQRCDDGNTYLWQEAKDYCENLVLGGYSDWRLPTKDELKSLVVCTNGTPTPLADYPDEPYDCDNNNGSYDVPTIDPSFTR
ncbi:MAG: DUF1566 domain-containing protein [Candidatus Electrothrix sp. AW3_4]|nr:DUF1566 domain-containing protein [Candidatus Electrothrix gigas]